MQANTDPHFDNPEIIITVPEDATTCKWVSVGWYTEKNKHTSEAQELMTKAQAAIREAVDIPDAKQALEDAGFTVTINPNYWDQFKNY